MSAASYAYKPATGGFEGASTVVPLKEGGFLEVRRGEKTRWVHGDERRVWDTLEEWKASLPEGAVIEERETRSKGSFPRRSHIPTDFRTAYLLYSSIVGFDPRSTPITVETNASVAKQYVRMFDYAQAYKELDKPPYEKFLCSHYHKSGHINNIIFAQRISDGEFIPLYFDIGRKILHSPSEYRDVVGVKGDTFAALGVRPVFMLPSCRFTGRMRVISLEKPAVSE